MKKTLTRETAKLLNEHARDELIAECYALKVKLNKGTLTPKEYERFRLLLKCGMLPSNPPAPRPITPERDAYLRYLARFKNAAGRDVHLILHDAEESQRIRFWQAEHTSNALSNMLDIAAGDNKHIRQAMERQLDANRRLLTDRANKAIMTEDEKTIARMRNPPAMKNSREQKWLMHRVEIKGFTAKDNEKRWNSIRDMAVLLGMNYKAVERMESELESRPEVIAYLKKNEVPLRKERRKNVTKRK